MQTELVVAVLAGLGGMLGWGFSEFATKKSVDKVGTISSLVWAHVFGTLLLFGILFIKKITSEVPVNLSLTPHELIGVIFFGTLQTAVYYFAYKGFEKGKVSILSPIFASFAGLVALFSVLLFGEVIHVGLGLALLVTFGGVLLINLDSDMLRLKQIRISGVDGLKEILVATILATIWTLGWDKFTAEKDWLVYTTFMFVFMTLSALWLAYLTRTRLFKMGHGAWGFLWLIAIGEVVAYLAITLGYSSTSYTSVVAILSGASSLPTIILARVFIKEKIAPLQTVAALIIITGIILVTLT